jgi:hypothetical protein
MVQGPNLPTPPIVWVEVGRNIPRHFWKATLLSKAIHPKIHQILVTDRFVTKSTLKSKECEYLEIIHCPESIRLTNFRNRMINNFEGSQQMMFWINTTARFFYLDKSLRELGIEKCIHLESDSILLNREGIQEFFCNKSALVGFPMQSRNVGCASIFLVNGLEALNAMLSFFETEQISGFRDDMQLLGDFAKNSAFAYILNSNLEGEKSEVIFDAQSIGRFYLGTDSRNQRWPFSSRGLLDERRTDHFKLDVPINYSFQRVLSGIDLTIYCEKGSMKLSSIHIHSKNIPNTITRLEKSLRKALKPRIKLLWSIGRFDLLVFVERLFSVVSRRILRKKSYEIRLR